MLQSHLTPSGERIIEPMIGLARCSKRHRIIVAGSQRSELMFELYRRGYSRVATTTTCGLPDGQFDVALVDWRQHSISALETTLACSGRPKVEASPVVPHTTNAVAPLST